MQNEEAATVTCNGRELWTSRKSMRTKLGLKSYYRSIVRGQGEWDTDIIREARKAVQRGEEGERPCQKGTCQGEGDRDGGLVRHTERALRSEAGQGPDEADVNPVHLLRHPHGKRGAAGGLLKRKYAHGKVLSRGTTPLSLRMDKKSGRNDRDEI